jgi:hypothetical protein
MLYRFGHNGNRIPETAQIADANRDDDAEWLWAEFHSNLRFHRAVKHPKPVK